MNFINIISLFYFGLFSVQQSENTKLEITFIGENDSDYTRPRFENINKVTCLNTNNEKYEKMFPKPQFSAQRSGHLPLITTLYNVHTKEVFPIFEKTSISRSKILTFFRCRGFGFIVEIDNKLIEIILEGATHFEAMRTEIISGYRSQKFNEILTKKGRHVATKSRHTKGQAIDFRFDSENAVNIGKWLKKNFEGGVGVYSIDNFVHVDVGPKRSWDGN